MRETVRLIMISPAVGQVRMGRRKGVFKGVLACHGADLPPGLYCMMGSMPPASAKSCMPSQSVHFGKRHNRYQLIFKSFQVTLSRLLILYIFTYPFFIQTYCSDTVTSCPKMIAPTGTFEIYSEPEVGHRINS